MKTIVYKYEIPDPLRPIPQNEHSWGPSGHLIPFTPIPVSAEQIVGRVIDEISAHVGTYGMGGPGFFGLRLGAEWLVIAVWGAAEWMAARERCLEDIDHQEYGRPSPCLPSDGELEKHVAGQKIRSIEVRRASLCIILDNEFDLTIEESPDRRPMQGSAKKKFTEDDDLRKAVFFAPTTEIWV
jgi:hypothetical protein